MLRTRPTTTFFGLLLLATGLGADAQPDPLPRRGFFGTKVEAAPDGVGVRVVEVIPGSTAEALALKPGDLITDLGDAKVEGPQAFVAMLAGRKAGEPVTITYARDGESRKGSAELKERPRETVEGAEVVYGSVESKSGRLRTLLTRPEGNNGRKRPALFVIQGLGGFSVENSGPVPAPYDAFVDAFNKRGYVTFRVEKPGQGDSQGGPTRDADFEAELDGYRQGLKALKASPDVDPDRVIVFGHSMGGVMGPLIAAENPVKGVAAYGTAFKTWNEYLLENTRRQRTLAGDDYAEIDRALRLDAALQYLLYHEGKSPEEILKSHPDLERSLAETVVEGKYVFGRHVDFFRQLAAKNLPEAWVKFGGHALAGWGKADFVSAEADHALIAEVVNRARPGHGIFLAVEGVDHGFQAAKTQEESFAKLHGGAPGPFDPAFLNALIEWADRLVGPKGA